MEETFIGSTKKSSSQRVNSNFTRSPLGEIYMSSSTSSCESFDDYSIENDSLNPLSSSNSTLSSTTSYIIRNQIIHNTPRSTPCSNRSKLSYKSNNTNNAITGNSSLINSKTTTSEINVSENIKQRRKKRSTLPLELITEKEQNIASNKVEKAMPMNLTSAKTKSSGLKLCEENSTNFNFPNQNDDNDSTISQLTIDSDFGKKVTNISSSGKLNNLNGVTLRKHQQNPSFLWDIEEYNTPQASCNISNGIDMSSQTNYEEDVEKLQYSRQQRLENLGCKLTDLRCQRANTSSTKKRNLLGKEILLLELEIGLIAKS